MPRSSSWLFMACLGAGCSVHSPLPSKPHLDIPDHFQESAGPQARSILSTGAWWLEFGDSHLNALVDTALQNNPNLAQAKARIDRARAQTGIDNAALWPMLSANPAATRVKSSRNIDTGFSIPASAGTPTSLAVSQDPYASRFRLSLDASYEADVWGRLRDSANASALLETASIEDFNTARLSLATTVVTSYLLLRTHQAQLEILRQTEALSEDIFEAQKDSTASGVADESGLDSALRDVSDARSQSTRMRESISLDLHGLETLCGAIPGTLRESLLHRPAQHSLRLPSPLVEIPSSVLKRRPDVRRAEAQLDAALLQISAARADFFPTLKLTTSLGAESSALANLLEPGSTIWSLAAQITQPIFDGGRRKAQLALASAHFEEISGSYQSTVIQVLREVEDGLTTVDSLRLQWVAADAAARAAARMAERAQHRYEVGLSPRVAYLEAQRDALKRQQSLLDIEGQLFIAHATLRKVLGGV